MQKFEMHTSHMDVDDLKQIADIGIIKAYQRYDYNYNDKDYKDIDSKIGFIPFLKATVEGEIRKAIRDVLKPRRKDYNIHEIAISSVDQSIPNSNGEKEVSLSEVIEDEKSTEDFRTLELRMEIENYLSCLDEKNKNMICDCFFNNMSQRQIGEKYGISQCHASRLLKKSLSKMKAMSKSKYNQEKFNKSKIKNKKTTANNKIVNKNKEEIAMKKGVIDTKHALEYFERSITKERSLDEIMDIYCNAYEISRSELTYALHTTCSSSFNDIVDKYMKFENDYEEEKAVPKQDKKSKVPYRQPVPCPDLVPINHTEPKPEKESKRTNPLEGLNIIDLRIGLDSLEASISKETVILKNLPEDVELTVEELKTLRDDINKLIEIKESLSINALK